MNSTDYSQETVPVQGGDLAVGVWGSPDNPPLLAIHGVTSTHMDWMPAAPRLADSFRVIAPDLRGRGRSSEITGPWGMSVHVDDLVAILDHYGIENSVIAGHSMGAFVAVLAALRHPDRFPALVLVDGGLPAVDANEGGDALTRIVLDAARERLETRFTDPDAYLDQVRATLPPGTELDDLGAQIARYDLRFEDGRWRVEGTYDAIDADARHIGGSDAADALAQLDVPAILLRAPRGLPPRMEGLYSQREVDEWTTRVSALSARTVPGVDHGSILREDAAIDAILESARSLPPTEA